jgi:hypothetical protein
MYEPITYLASCLYIEWEEEFNYDVVIPSIARYISESRKHSGVIHRLHFSGIPSVYLHPLP